MLAPLAVLVCEPGLEVTERALAILGEHGLPADGGAELAHFVLATSVTLVSTKPGPGADAPDPEAELRHKRVALASLPPGKYPKVAAAAPFLVDCPDDDAYFRRGVEFVVGGLRQQARAAAKVTTR